jgi:hypothetical protein
MIFSIPRYTVLMSRPLAVGFLSRNPVHAPRAPRGVAQMQSLGDGLDGKNRFSSESIAIANRV